MQSGYEEIGMDHFSLPHDTLYRAQQQQTLHRNFMGYTHSETDLLIGLGASAIGDAKYAYAQNARKVEDYTMAIQDGGLAVVKGHILSDDDLFTRKIILDIVCQGIIASSAVTRYGSDDVADALRGFVSEGILRQCDDGWKVTDMGRAFIRNICSIFDRNLNGRLTGDDVRLFSKSI